MARDKDWNRILAEAHDNFTIALDYDVNNNPIYIGRAAIGTAKTDPFWQIRKLTFDVNNNVTDIQFPNTDDAYAYQWSQRATYTYS